MTEWGFVFIWFSLKWVYRVIHAVELFRSDTSLKVLELASKSGFNSGVSFGMAFRLYMGEKPGDWCRREKFRLEKLKK